MNLLEPAGAWLEDISRLATSDAAGNLGSLLGGLAAVAAVLYAVVEFRSWKHRRREENRVAAAAHALPVLEAFALSLHDWLNAFSLGAFQARNLSGTAALAEASKLIQQVKVKVEERQQELARTGAEAAAVLAEDEVAPLRYANSIYLSLGSAVWMRMQSEAVRWDQEHAIGRNPPRQDLPALVEPMLQHLERQLEGALNEGRRVLGAIARHERPRGKRWKPEPALFAFLGSPPAGTARTEDRSAARSS